MRIVGIDHVVLRVTDLERAVAFYGRVLGCTIERRQDEIGLVQLRAGSQLIDLVTGVGSRRGHETTERDGRNMDHFCLKVAEFEPNEVRRELDELGVGIESAGLRYGATGKGFSFYITDPDGNHIELRG